MADELHPGAGPDGHQHAGDERNRGDPTMVSPHPDVVVFLCSTYDGGIFRRTRPRAGPGPTSTRSTWAPTCCGGCGTEPRTSGSSSRPDSRRPPVRPAGPTRGPGALPGLGLPAHRAADGAEPVGHVDVAVTALGLVRVEPGPSSLTENSRPPDSSHNRTSTLRLRRVLGRVLQRLEAAEVDRRLHLGGVAADAVGDDRRPPAGCGSLRPGAPRPARCRPAAAGRCRAPARAAPGSSPAPRRRAGRASRTAASGSSAMMSLARRRLTASATRCCCAPSCRLRSTRRRSASPLATMRARDSRSSSACLRSSSSVVCSAVSSCELWNARPTCRASSVSTRSSSSENASAVGGPLDDDQPSSSPAWLTGATRTCASSRPSSTPGSQTDAQALPETPARVTTGRSRADTTTDRGPGRAPTAPAPGPHPMPV